jgi:hypothetical protein
MQIAGDPKSQVTCIRSACNGRQKSALQSEWRWTEKRGVEETGRVDTPSSVKRPKIS